MAAPFVAGGLAVMKQLFRDQLSNTELVTRLFETANDQGAYANRAVYGRGAMDLRAATSPVGVLGVPIESNRAVGRGAVLVATRLQAGEPFGDGPERSLAGTEFAAFDDLGAPFWFDLGGYRESPGDAGDGHLATGAAARSMTAGFHEFPAPVPAWSRTAEAVHWRIGRSRCASSAAARSSACRPAVRRPARWCAARSRPTSRRAAGRSTSPRSGNSR